MIIWLTGIPGVGKIFIAHALRDMLRNGRPAQVVNASEVRYFHHPDTAPSVEEQVATVAWVAHLLASNDITTIVSCVSPIKEQRDAIRHRSFDHGIPFYEVWVDAGGSSRYLKRKFQYEPPEPPDARAFITQFGEWDTIARQVLSELDL